jgi:hypothetical protein
MMWRKMSLASQSRVREEEEFEEEFEEVSLTLDSVGL